MNPSHDAPTLPPAPPPLALSTTTRVTAAAAALVGAAAFGWALTQGHAGLAWSAYLIGAFFALTLGLFGALWIAIQYLSKGVWSVSMRRVPEAMTAWLLPGGALALLVGLGGHHLYHWTDAEAVAADALLTHKAPFLNLGGFYSALALSGALWLVFAAVLVRNSRRQDQTGQAALSHRNITVSAIFVVLFALSFSAVSFYLLMSLDAHWFSTMYAVLTFTDLMQSGLAFVALVVALLMRRGQLRGFVDENHLHSLVKMLFATTGFWAYIYFCQFLLIWYGNIPEETAYFIRRWDNGWLPYLGLLPLLKFVVPFVLLVPRDNKRHPGRVASVAVLILFAQFWELLLLVSPAIGHGAHAAHAHLPVVEFLVTLGFFGLFVLVFAWSLGRHAAVPLKDPRIADCLHYHC